MFKQKFLNEIRVTFKSGGFTCAFNERELIEFHNYLEKSFPFDAEGKRKQGVVCVGRQPAEDEDTEKVTTNHTGCRMWILNHSVHIDSKGNLVPLHKSTFAWQPIGGPQIELAGRSTATIDLCSHISLPLESKESLHKLLLLMQNLLKHNFVAGTCNSYPLVLTLSCTHHHACFKNL